MWGEKPWTKKLLKIAFDLTPLFNLQQGNELKCFLFSPKLDMTDWQRIAIDTVRSFGLDHFLNQLTSINNQALQDGFQRFLLSAFRQTGQ